MNRNVKTQINNFVSFLGQSIADEYQTRVCKSNNTMLMFVDDKQQITINISTRDSSSPLSNALEAFEPRKLDEPEQSEEAKEPEPLEECETPKETEDSLINIPTETIIEEVIETIVEEHETFKEPEEPSVTNIPSEEVIEEPVCETTTLNTPTTWAPNNSLLTDHPLVNTIDTNNLVTDGTTNIVTADGSLIATCDITVSDIK